MMKGFELFVRDEYKNSVKDIQEKIDYIEMNINQLEAEKDQAQKAFISATDPDLKKSIEISFVDIKRKIEEAKSVVKKNRPRSQT